MKLNTAESATTIFNAFIDRLAERSERGYRGVQIYSKGDCIVRINEHATQVNTMIIYRVRRRDSDQEWFSQFIAAVYYGGYSRRGKS